MSFVRANPPGWALFEILYSAQMNVIDSQRCQANGPRWAEKVS
jgi:hypothetical protein